MKVGRGVVVIGICVNIGLNLLIGRKLVIILFWWYDFIYVIWI